MKKLLILFGILASASFAHAREDFTRVPAVNTYVSNAVYISSFVNQSNANAGSAVIISSFPSILYGVVISTPGYGSKFELFDSWKGTDSFIWPNIRRILDLDTSRGSLSLVTPPPALNIYCSSGISIANTGISVAEVTVIYRER